MSDPALFCRIAQRAGLLSSAQGQEVLRACAETGAAGVGELCLELGFLDAAQVEMVRRLGDDPAPPSDPAAEAEARGKQERGALLGRLAVMKRLATEGQVEQCLRIQEELAGEGRFVMLGELLVRKAQVARGDMDQLLEFQRTRRIDLGPAPEEAPSPERRAALEVFLQLKRAVAAGELEDAARLRERLRDDPEYARLAQANLEKAFGRRAQTRVRREGGRVVDCPTCGLPMPADEDGTGRCGQCGAGLAGP